MLEGASPVVCIRTIERIKVIVAQRWNVPCRKSPPSRRSPRQDSQQLHVDRPIFQQLFDSSYSPPAYLEVGVEGKRVRSVGWAPPWCRGVAFARLVYFERNVIQAVISVNFGHSPLRFKRNERKSLGPRTPILVSHTNESKIESQKQNIINDQQNEGS
jgi:hypothetical protein